MLRLLLIIVVLLSGCETNEHLNKRIETTRLTTSWEGQKWEYITSSEEPNILGADGWEMCATTTVSGQVYQYHYKRPLPTIKRVK